MLTLLLFWGIVMKHMAFALSFLLSGVSLGHAQSGNGPAELPPAAFEGREFTDSQGCVFLRSTFGGQVTWIPRFGPDRMPVCGQTPTDFAALLPQAVSEPEPVAEAAPAPTPTQAPTPAPVASAPVAQAAAAPAPRPAAQPQRAAAPQRAAQPRPRFAQADASGRHPDCPANAPFGQLVDTVLGRPLVRCVTSTSLFVPELVSGPAHVRAHVRAGASSHRHAAARSVQVGSFRVSANATRLQARLQSAGMPARVHHASGFAVVTVGPFSSADSAHAALASVRGMGFGDAFLR